jgi:hypothetical protein
MVQDIKKMDQILTNRSVDYDFDTSTITKDYVKNNGQLNTNRAFVKAILCMFASRNPVSFKDNSTIEISNAWIKNANSNNYHHIFPRKYLERKNLFTDSQINNVVNITMLDSEVNQEIKDKAPSVYFKKYTENERLSKTLNGHLISLINWGIENNDYNIFMDRRADKIARELKKKMK